jgi:hypothetical protein
MAYLRIRKFVKNPRQPKNNKEETWVTKQTPTSLAARLTPEERDAALIAELRYLEEQLAWQSERG